MLGVIFDYDGLMVNSEPLQSKALERIIHKYGKIPVFDELGFVHVVGISSEANTQRIKDHYHIDEDLDVLQRERAAFLAELTTRDHIKPQPGLMDLIGDLRANNIPIAVASGNFREVIEKGLTLLGVKDNFQGIVSGEDVTLGKPDPEIYLKAADILRVEPGRCVVLEDSATGIEGAANAGMIPIAVTNRFTQDQDFRRADVILGSLEQINLGLLTSRVEGTIRKEGVRKERKM